MIRLGFTVRTEAISGVLLPQEEADILPGADILPPAVFTPNTFYRIKGEIMIKGAGDYIGGFLGPAGSEHAGPDIPASRARVSRGSGVCRGDAIIVRGRRRGAPDHARHRQGRRRSGSLVFQNWGKRFCVVFEYFIFF